MIVKTGANYQAEGGYIEAAYDNGIVTVKKNGEDAFSIGIGENGYAVEVEVQNDTSSNFNMCGLSNAGSLQDVYGMVSGVLANTKTTFKTLALINVLQRISYSDAQSVPVYNMKIESECVELARGGGDYYAYKIVKMPPAGEKIKMRLYI